MESKFIITNRSGFEEAIIFPDTLTHADIAGRVFGKQNVVSAGFVLVDFNGVSSYGSSVSLGIDSRGDADKVALKRALGILSGDA